MTSLRRDEIAQIVGNSPKLVKAFEEIQSNATDAASKVATNVAATQALQDATAVTLSLNDSLNNERVLAVGDGMTLTDQGPGQQIVVGLDNVPLTQGGYELTLNLYADSSVDMPASGLLLTTDYFADGPFANDAAAATGGIGIGQLYRRTDGVVAWRQA